jgi:hypothetical protein
MALTPSTMPLDPGVTTVRQVPQFSNYSTAYRSTKTIAAEPAQVARSYASAVIKASGFSPLRNRAIFRRANSPHR